MTSDVLCALHVNRGSSRRNEMAALLNDVRRGFYHRPIYGYQKVRNS
jgi:hypothetical protein